MRSPGRLLEALLKGHFSLLLTTLLGMFLILPLIPVDLKIVERLMSGFGILVLISCMRAVVETKRLLVFIILLGILNVLFNGADVIDPLTNPTLVAVEQSVALLYYVLVFISIMRRVLDRTPVTTDKIFGAISAYMLIGIVWAWVFSLFQTLDPASFSIPETLQSNRALGLWALYFSFVSLTTIGYGDIIPLTPAAQTYAYLEAVCGQIFLTVLIARLVALHILHGSSKQGK